METFFRFALFTHSDTVLSINEKKIQFRTTLTHTYDTLTCLFSHFAIYRNGEIRPFSLLNSNFNVPLTHSSTKRPHLAKINRKKNWTIFPLDQWKLLIIMTSWQANTKLIIAMEKISATMCRSSWTSTQSMMEVMTVDDVMECFRTNRWDFFRVVVSLCWCAYVFVCCSFVGGRAQPVHVLYVCAWNTRVLKLRLSDGLGAPKYCQCCQLIVRKIRDENYFSRWNKDV